MTRVLFTSSRHPGFVLPFVQLARALVERGDEVFILTGTEYADRVADAGATFLRLPYDDVPPQKLPRPAGRVNGARQIGRALREIFLDPVEVDFRTTLAISERYGIDVVVCEPLFVGAAILGLLPRAERPGVLSAGLMPLPLTSADTPPYGAGLSPIDGPANRMRNVALGAAADLLVHNGVRRAFAHEVRRLTGVRPHGALLDFALLADAWAQLTVPQFEYPRRSLSPKVRFVGPLPPPELGAMPDWWDYAERRPVVHVTQGTYANADPTELIVPTIRALADEPVLVVATTGGPDPAGIERAYGGPLPANTRVERFLPYDKLLPASSVMVNNGGYGAVQHALRWGLPLVVSGLTEDKAEVNARVAWSGVGVNLRRQRPEPADIRVAVREVLDDPAFRRAAVRMGAAIATTDATAGVLALVDELADRSVPRRIDFPASA